MRLKEKVSFDKLLHDVVERGLCNRCGGCVSFCSADRIGALEAGKDGFPRYASREKCLECGICYLICPQTHLLKDEVREKFGWSEPVGLVQEVVSARARDPEILAAGTDGGAVTALLSHMLEAGLVDGAIVSERTGLYDRRPVVATSREGLVRAAGSHWAETGHLEHVGAEYSTYVSVIPTLRELAPKAVIRLAVVGTPCQIEAIRKMQVLRILPADVVTFAIGLFCMQSFALSELLEKEFCRAHQIDPGDVVKVNIKDDFMLKLKSGITMHVPLEEIEGIARPACRACTDFANGYADIAVGGLGSPDGWTTALIRTIAGKRAFTDAMRRGHIEVKTQKTADAQRAEMARILGIVEAHADRKRQRGERRLAELAA
ncbi:coenzyme F420 hydrogenase [candidate division WOR-3 bacterium]|nr:coenzyme F420 hydrogenase [candidate division WOR-3 bacterium]